MKNKSFVLIALLALLLFPGYLLKKSKTKLTKASHHAHESFLCKSLKNIPMADDLGIVTAVRSIQLNDVKYPYNGSIVQEGSGYLLFFRFDDTEKNPEDGSYTHYHSHIAYTRLDKEFRQVGPCFDIDTKSHISQDPRAFWCGDELYLTYNDVVSSSLFSRQMHLAHIDKQSFCLQKIHNLDLNLQPVEKNWVPFVLQDENKQNQIYFEYSCNPHKLLRMSGDKETIDQLIFPSIASYQDIPWPSALGPIRGGTPAIEVEEGYLTFFHSSFKEDKVKWYVMGAYLFDKRAPFRIKAMSSYPILYKGIFCTAIEGVSNPKLKCIFPSGIVKTWDDNKELVHVSCGENDCAQKIVTFDLAKLIQSLTPIPER